jgi:anaphase-promoting complex subunit 1
VDVDTQLPVYIPIEVTLKESALYSETVFSHVTPCILPDQRSLKRVRVCGPRYWPQDIELPAIGQPCWERASEGGPFVGSFLYVKRKVGARPYADDPIGCRSLLSRALHKNGKGSCSELSSKGELSKVDQLVSTFSADPSILAFAQLFCKGAHNSKSNGEFNNFCLLALFESVSCDRPALLQTYLALYTGVETLVDRASGRGTSVNSASSDSLSIQSLKVAVAYCDVFGQNEGGPLVQRTFVAALAKSVDNLLSRHTIFTSHIQSPILKPYISELFSYLDNQQFPSIHAHQFNVDPKRTLLQEMRVRRILFSCFLCWYEIPQPQLVTAALQQMEKVLPEFQSTTKAESQTVLPLLALVLPGMPLPALLHINDCLPLLTLKKSK